jgi:hypothetical protein
LVFKSVNDFVVIAPSHLQRHSSTSSLHQQRIKEIKNPAVGEADTEGYAQPRNNRGKHQLATNNRHWAGNQNQFVVILNRFIPADALNKMHWVNLSTIKRKQWKKSDTFYQAAAPGDLPILAF